MHEFEEDEIADLYAEVAIAEEMLKESLLEARELRISITKMHREIVKLERLYNE